MSATGFGVPDTEYDNNDVNAEIETSSLSPQSGPVIKLVTSWVVLPGQDTMIKRILMGTIGKMTITVKTIQWKTSLKR